MVVKGGTKNQVINGIPGLRDGDEGIRGKYNRPKLSSSTMQNKDSKTHVSWNIILFLGMGLFVMAVIFLIRKYTVNIY